MYVRGGLRLSHVLRDTWPMIVVASLWSTTVISLHEVAGIRTVTVPLAPVTMIGIVVSLYLGFKTNSAYQRWWEARQIWGGIINESRILAIYALTFVPQDGEGRPIARRLVRRQLAFMNALAFMLRARSRLRPSERHHLFSRRHTHTWDAHTATPEAYRRFLPPDEVEAVEAAATPPLDILRRQSEDLGALLRAGLLDNNRFVEMASVLRKLNTFQGQCERIKNTPFPRQINVFGRVFTYVFIAFVPLALIQAFEDTISRHNPDELLFDEYMFFMLPFAVLISWVFYVLEKVSESCEDPFEWAPTDVPLAALTRVVEIDLLEMLGERDDLAPHAPVAGVIY